METQLKGLNTLGKILQRQEERTSDNVKMSELAAEYSRRFDELTKNVIEQRMGDALSESARICDRFTKTVGQISGIRRLLIAGLILSGIDLTALAAVLITLWLR